MTNPTNVVESFNEAVTRDENFVDGKIDWNFVEADVYMDASEFGFDIPDDFDVLFNTLASEFEQAQNAA
jgi:hypothetical protein